MRLPRLTNPAVCQARAYRHGMGLRAWWSRPAAIVRCQNCRAPIARELAVERAFCSETCLDSWISETAW